MNALLDLALLGFTGANVYLALSRAPSSALNWAAAVVCALVLMYRGRESR